MYRNKQDCGGVFAYRQDCDGVPGNGEFCIDGTDFGCCTPLGDGGGPAFEGVNARDAPDLESMSDSF